MKNSFFLALFIYGCSSVNAGLDSFTNLVFVEEWLIERKIDLKNNEIKCRASIPSNANWFGARVRLGSKNELIKPNWIFLKVDPLFNSKISKVKEILEDCRSGFLFIPNNF